MDELPYMQNSPDFTGQTEILSDSGMSFFPEAPQSLPTESNAPNLFYYPDVYSNTQETEQSAVVYPSDPAYLPNTPSDSASPMYSDLFAETSQTPPQDTFIPQVDLYASYNNPHEEGGFSTSAGWFDQTDTGSSQQSNPYRYDSDWNFDDRSQQ